ncbi:RTX toxin, partial [Vibrio sinensis]
MKLFKDEGGTDNHEQGKWVAYLDGNAVASGMFVANDGKHSGTYHFDENDLNGVAFDSIVFEAVDFVDEPTKGNDSSDYFLSGFEASGTGAYAANQGDELKIPISELLGNDVDPDGDNIRFTHVSDANHGAEIRVVGDFVYIQLDPDHVGNTSFDYVITDDKGGFDEATVSIIVNPLPPEVGVNAIEMLDTTVLEGENLVYKVELEQGVLKETRYDITFGQAGDSATEQDVDLSQVQFTHGVTYDADNNQIVVPVGVGAFSVLIPTVIDGVYEVDESFTLTLDTQSGSGTIENVDIPKVSVSQDVRVSEGDDAVFMVSLNKDTEAPTTINLELKHLSTDGGDVDGITVEYQTPSGWQTLTVGASGDVELPAGVTEARVTIATHDDNNAPIYEGEEKFELVVTGVNGAQGGDRGQATLTDDGSVTPDQGIADDDRPTITSVTSIEVEEGQHATFDVTMSNPSTTATKISLSLFDGDATAPEDFDASRVVIELGSPSQTVALNANGSFEFYLPAGETEFKVSVQTTDDAFADDGEQFSLSVKTEYQQNGVVGTATINDEDGSNQNNPRDAIAIELTGPDSVMEGEETAPFTITLSDPANSGTQTPLAAPGSIVTLSYSYTNADGDDITEVLEAVIGPDGLTATFSIPTTQDDVYETGQAFTVSVVSIKDGNGSDAKDLFEALDVTNAHQTVAIDDSKDNPPEAEDFTVELVSNGGAAIVFNSDTPANDHISDEEDDASNTPVEVVITQLPTSGVLLYDGVEITPDQLTKFNPDGSVDGVLTKFDASKITYQNDDESTGFILGVKESPEDLLGDESTESFLNWGEPVDGKPNQRELTFEGSNDVITITANSANDQPLAQYYA